MKTTRTPLVDEFDCSITGRAEKIEGYKLCVEYECDTPPTRARFPLWCTGMPDCGHLVAQNACPYRRAAS